MDNNKRKVTLLDVLKIMFKRVRIRTLIFLVITASATSFAWFVYSTKVSTGITAHIESWNILFTNSETELSEYINFDIPSIYPGMDDYIETIEISNMGEKSASIDYEITALRVLDTTYLIEPPITSDYIVDMLANDFPFHITFSLTNTTIDATHGTTIFTLSTVWPYESGNDALDTLWGNNAYIYQQNFSGNSSVSITVKITASQSA